MLHLINTIIIGYVLTLSGLVLNTIDGNKVGAAMALLSFAFAYFHERDYAYGTKFPKVTLAMNVLSVLFCAMSLFAWLIG